MKKCDKCFSSTATRMVNGMHLCDSCAFREENAQCYKCQMYLPRAELVFWRGQLYCQYCLMDIRDEELRQRRYSKPAETHGPSPSYFKKSYAKDYIKNEYCERCGATLYTAYIVNGRKLCKNCADELRKEYGEKGLRFSPIRYKIRNKPIIVSIAEALLGVAVFAFNKIKPGKKKKTS